MKSLLRTVLEESAALTRYAAAPFATTDRPAATPEWLAGLRERIEPLQAKLNAFIGLAEQIPGDAADGWTGAHRVLFREWLNEHYPNEASAGTIALGEAWQHGLRVGVSAEAARNIVVEPGDASTARPSAASDLSAWLVEGLNGHNEPTRSIFLDEGLARAAASTLFRASISRHPLNSSSPPAVPDGWRLVRVEPRPEVCDKGVAGICCAAGCGHDERLQRARESWAQLATAPESIPRSARSLLTVAADVIQHDLVPGAADPYLYVALVGDIRAVLAGSKNTAQPSPGPLGNQEGFTAAKPK